MKLDKNTIIGFSLLLVLFIGFFWYNSSMQMEAQARQERANDSTRRVKDSTDKVALSRITPQQKAAAAQDSVRRDSLDKLQLAAGFGAGASLGNEQIITIENDLVKASFSTKGGQLKTVELKKYISSADKKNIVLGGAANDKLSYNVKTGDRTVAPVTDLFFTPSEVIKNADGSHANRQFQQIFDDRMHIQKR